MERQERRAEGVASIRQASMAARGSRAKKRHAAVDLWDLLMCAVVHAAGLQERDGGVLSWGAPSRG